MSGNFDKAELYKTQRLNEKVSIVKFVTQEMVRSLNLDKHQFESEQAVLAIAKKLKVKLKIISVSQGKISEQTFYLPGPEISILRVVKHSTIEYSYLLVKEALEELPHFDISSFPDDTEVNFSKTDLPSLIMNSAAECRSCGLVLDAEAPDKKKCGCTFCTLCSPVLDYCSICSTLQHFCKLEPMNPNRVWRDFESKRCPELCICRGCYLSIAFENCKFCYFNQAAPKEDPNDPTKCFKCRSEDGKIEEACEGGCTLCIECLRASIDRDGLCITCRSALTNEALDFIETY
mmetsp:Transcript_15791/g.28871  ORF Transcript_15791/g.28871 Transcript_15791/m.28871 type:complete len:290 (-) Transcript_15791:907-1776(-)